MRNQPGRLGGIGRVAAALVAVTIAAGTAARSAAGQVPALPIEFDLITFDAINVDTPPAGSFSMRLGLLVNTGSVPITQDDWLAGTTHAHADAPIQNFVFHIGAPLGPGGFVLQPGQAIGNNHPLLTALLEPAESLAFDQPLDVLALQAEGASPGSTAQASLCVQAGSRVVQTEAALHFGPGQAFLFEPTSARRTSAVPAQSAIALLGGGCDPSAQLFAVGEPAHTGPGLVAFGSNMPTLGNNAFGLSLAYCPNPGKFSCPHGPYLLFVSAAPVSATVKGCPLWVDLDTAVMVVGQMSQAGFAHLDAPIPANPALVGGSVAVQAALLSEQAANGVFATTNALRITIGDDCDL